ncbi:Uncharacterised protein [Orientia tsutsugamushi]|nr:hypothetical protein OTSTA763_0342 [Orientia tsutsugamushi str. TA763]SPP23939.1 Uncharacterised protein [Orientia tsutsugamushi]
MNIQHIKFSTLMCCVLLLLNHIDALYYTISSKLYSTLRRPCFNTPMFLTYLQCLRLLCYYKHLLVAKGLLLAPLGYPRLLGKKLANNESAL